MFETTIRVVGGLLGAHELSGDKLFLDKALELADRMLIAFNRCEVPTPQAHTHPFPFSFLAPTACGASLPPLQPAFLALCSFAGIRFGMLNTCGWALAWVLHTMDALLAVAWRSSSGVPFGTLGLKTKRAYNPSHVGGFSSMSEVCVTVGGPVCSRCLLGTMDHCGATCCC